MMPVDAGYGSLSKRDRTAAVSRYLARPCGVTYSTVLTRFSGPAPAALRTARMFEYVYSAWPTTSSDLTACSVAGSRAACPDMKSTFPALTAGLYVSLRYRSHPGLTASRG